MSNLLGLEADLRFERGWKSSIQLCWNRQNASVRIFIECDNDRNTITKKQFEALELLVSNQNQILQSCELEMSTRLSSLGKSEFFDSTVLVGVFFSEDRYPEVAEFSFLFNSDAEPELGLAIQLFNGKIVHFGTQDDVL